MPRMTEGPRENVIILSLSQTALVLTCLQYKSFENTVRKRAISTFPSLFSTCSDNFLQISSNLKLSSANSFSLEKSKIYRLGKG